MRTSKASMASVFLACLVFTAVDTTNAATASPPKPAPEPAKPPRPAGRPEPLGEETSKAISAAIRQSVLDKCSDELSRPGAVAIVGFLAGSFGLRLEGERVECFTLDRVVEAIVTLEGKEPAFESLKFDGLRLLFLEEGAVGARRFPPGTIIRFDGKRWLDETSPEALAKAVRGMTQDIFRGKRHQRMGAASALGSIARLKDGVFPDLPKIAVPALIRAARATDENVAGNAISSLGRYGADAAPAVPALIRALRRRDGFVAANAAYVLAELGPQAGSAIPALLRYARLVEKSAGPDVGINNGLGALRQITEEDFGRDIDKWEAWWQEHKDSILPAGEKSTTRPARTKAEKRLNVARLYLRSGMKDKAVEILREIIQRFPDSKEAAAAGDLLQKLGSEGGD